MQVGPGAPTGGGPAGGAHGNPGQLQHHCQGAQDAILVHEGRQGKMGE